MVYWNQQRTKQKHTELAAAILFLSFAAIAAAILLAKDGKMSAKTSTACAAQDLAAAVLSVYAREYDKLAQALEEFADGTN